MAVTTPISADAVVNTAIGQIGVTEQPFGSNKQPYGLWYGMNGVAWCAMFVSWVLHHAGFPIAITTAKGYAYCPYGVNYFKQQGAWADKSVRPKRGWIVFFDFPNDGVNRVSHTGIVEGVLADGRIACIEGNTNPAGGRTGGEVMRHNRSLSSIVGYGMIEYAPVSTPTPQPQPQPQPQPSGEKDRIKRLQSLVGSPADGIWGPNTEAAIKRNYISWSNGPARKSGAGNKNKELVRFMQQNGNRRFGLGMLEDGLVGGQVNHLIVVSLGQRDGVAGPNAWRALVK